MDMQALQPAVNLEEKSLAELETMLIEHDASVEQMIINAKERRTQIREAMTKRLSALGRGRAPRATKAVDGGGVSG